MENLYFDYVSKKRNPLPNFIYLNSGTESLLPTRTRTFIEKEHRLYEANPTYSWVGALDRFWSLQKTCAEFLNASACDLFFRYNVTEAMNAFILGIPLPENSEIVLTSLEYGAIANICRFKAETENLTLRVIDLPTSKEVTESWTGVDFTKLIVNQLSAKTSLLVASHVMTSNGLVLDVEKIAEHTRAKNIFFAVDGAHSIGQLDLDFSRFKNIDFYGGNFHKWLMGPKGTGFGWTNPKVQPLVKPLLAGWTTFEIAEPFNRFGEGNSYALKQLLPGTRDFCSFYGLEDTFSIWKELGPGKIRNKLSELRNLVAETMEKICPEYRLLSPKHCPSSLVSFELPEKLQQKGYSLLFDVLKMHQLQLAFPKIQTFDPNTGEKKSRWCVRFSPHLWNSEDEIVRACGILRNL